MPARQQASQPERGTPSASPASARTGGSDQSCPRCFVPVTLHPQGRYCANPNCSQQWIAYRAPAPVPPQAAPQPGEHDVCANRHGGADTSQAAFSRMGKRARTNLRDTVHEFIARMGEAGATAWEVEQALGLERSTTSARLSELKRDLRIQDSGQRRPTKTGAMAKVWVTA